MVTEHPAAALQTWVDDVSFDIHSRDPDFAAREALEAFRTLQHQMELAGLKLNTDKTGFLTSSKEAARALKALLREGDPEHYDVLRDLGVGLHGCPQATGHSDPQKVPEGQGQSGHHEPPPHRHGHPLPTPQRGDPCSDVLGSTGERTRPTKTTATPGFGSQRTASTTFWVS